AAKNFCRFEKRLNTLGKIDCDIANAFELAVDTHRSNEQAQVHCNRLGQGKNTLTERIDHKIVFVHTSFALLHEAGGIEIAFEYGFCRKLDLLVNKRAHTNK